MSIILPPLPEPPAWMNDEGDVFARQETPEMELSLPTMLYTTNQLRARDIEVAQLVLEAAAKVCRDFHATDSLSNYGLVMARMIDEVEVRHHE